MDLPSLLAGFRPPGSHGSDPIVQPGTCSRVRPLQSHGQRYQGTGLDSVCTVGDTELYIIPTCLAFQGLSTPTLVLDLLWFTAAVDGRFLVASSPASRHISFTANEVLHLGIVTESVLVCAAHRSSKVLK